MSSVEKGYFLISRILLENRSGIKASKKTLFKNCLVVLA